MNNSMQKAKEAKDMKNKLMLVRSPLSARQLLSILQRTPAEHIYRRPGKSGKEFEYVTATYMKKVLNYVFGWMWDFEVKEHGQEKDMVWVLGKLTIKDKTGKPMVIKEQFGRSEVKYLTEIINGKKVRTDKNLDFGNDLKSAASDALKKCAAELGIASDVYGRQEFKEIQKVDKGFTPPENGNGASKNAKSGDNLGGLMASETDISRIKEQAKKMGLNTVAQIESKIKMDVNFSKMTKTHASQILFALMSKK